MKVIERELIEPEKNTQEQISSKSARIKSRMPKFGQERFGELRGDAFGLQRNIIVSFMVSAAQLPSKQFKLQYNKMGVIEEVIFCPIWI